MVGTDSLLMCNSANTRVDCADINTHTNAYILKLYSFRFAVVASLILLLLGSPFLVYFCYQAIKNRRYAVWAPLTHLPVPKCSDDDRKSVNIYEKISNSNNDDFSEVNRDKASLEQISRNKARNWNQCVLKREIIENDIKESLTSDLPTDDSVTTIASGYVSLTAKCSSPTSPSSISAKV